MVRIQQCVGLHLTIKQSIPPTGSEKTSSGILFSEEDPEYKGFWRNDGKNWRKESGTVSLVRVTLGGRSEEMAY